MAKSQKLKPLSEPMMRVLTNLAKGRPADYGGPGGRSASGGLTGTMRALRKHGLIDSEDSITTAGEVASLTGFIRHD